MFFDYLHDSIYVVAVSAASVLAADPSARRRTIRASSSIRGSAGPAACALPLGSQEGDFDAFCNGFDPSIRFADAVCADCSVGGGPALRAERERERHQRHRRDAAVFFWLGWSIRRSNPMDGIGTAVRHSPTDA